MSLSLADVFSVPLAAIFSLLSLLHHPSLGTCNGNCSSLSPHRQPSLSVCRRTTNRSSLWPHRQTSLTHIDTAREELIGLDCIACCWYILSEGCYILSERCYILSGGSKLCQCRNSLSKATFGS